MREIGQNLTVAKRRVELLKGVVLILKVKVGRNKTACLIGHIESIYPSVFTFRTESGEIRTFSYNEVQTKSVKFLKKTD